MGSFVATAYGPPWDAIEGTGVTATGIKLAPGPQPMRGPYVVAVDPSVVPLGSHLKIWPNPFGNPNIIFTAADTGGAIVGNRIDFYDSVGRASQNAWGRRTVTVSIVGKGPANQAATGPANGPAGAHSPTPTAGAVTGPSGSDWQHLLLDLALLGFGVGLLFKGTKRSLANARTAA